MDQVEVFFRGQELPVKGRFAAFLEGKRTRLQEKAEAASSDRQSARHSRNQAGSVPPSSTTCGNSSSFVRGHFAPGSISFMNASESSL